MTSVTFPITTAIPLKSIVIAAAPGTSTASRVINDTKARVNLALMPVRTGFESDRLSDIRESQLDVI